MKEKRFSKEEIRLFEMIAGSLCGHENKKTEGTDCDPAVVYALAKGHGILPVVYDDMKEALTEEALQEELASIFKMSTVSFYRLLRAAGELIGKLSDAGIASVLLKGASVARFYPVPESRRSTDIDLLLADPKDLEKAREVLSEAGCELMKKKPGDPNHHEEWKTKGNRIVELHVSVTEPFDDAALNSKIDRIFNLSEEEIRTEPVMGTKISFLCDDLQALHLLLHMWMDFLRAGFGLKLLCDWVALWNRGIEKEDFTRFLSWTKELGLSKFLSAITAICVKHLGLQNSPDVELLMEEEIPPTLADELLFDVVETEREGTPGADRMVALRGNGFADYVREFHHQTVLTFPKASALIFPLPVLYPIVFFRFLYHAKTGENRRKVSGVIKSAASRGQLVKSLR